MEPKQFSREVVLDAVSRLKMLHHLAGATDPLIKMLEQVANLPDDPPRPAGEPPRFALEMSFYELASLPTSRDDPRPFLEFLMESVEKVLGQAEWADFVVKNGLN